MYNCEYCSKPIIADIQEATFLYGKFPVHKNGCDLLLAKKLRRQGVGIALALIFTFLLLGGCASVPKAGGGTRAAVR